ncbi:hypothetical protein BKA58DRAFT_132307 [Alternaria rosae]|uniref:uncharacterized protein n=1 Tax=Alternaria rosae TaxID=1187941 RepID=UPI001E8CC94B|nr:uncharacterized protein BKA58DRAFT_132307 [Alternaria rosae]KAH6875964.1 hypothetical protein BKA58DRAFT_132307 [Alternaria rosae]
MATAYYFAAHFNTSRTHATDASPFPASTLNTISPSTLIPVTHEPTQTQSLIHVAPEIAARMRGVTNPQQTSILFRLPAELRNQIYEELLCPDTPHHKDLATYSTPSRPPTVYPAILRTCRKIHEEAQDLLYTTHVFHAHRSLLIALPHLILPEKPILSPTSIAKIARWQLELRLDIDPRFSNSQATAAFSGAEFLQVKVWQSMFDGADNSVLKLFTGVRGVGVAKVTGCDDEGLARWLEKRMMMPIEEQENRERCCQCGKKSDEEMEWFGVARDAWTFGNR